MNPLKLVKPLSASGLNRKQRRLIQWQSFCILLLSVSLIEVAVYAGSEKRTADLWRADHAYPASARAQTETVYAPPSLEAAPDATPYYTATLIGKDGSRTALDGRSIEIDMGKERLLEMFLARQEQDRLLVWAPAKRGNNYFNRIIFRPGCANVFETELERVNLDAAGNDAVRYDVSH